MFLSGPFLKFPFLDSGVGATHGVLTSAGAATAAFKAGTRLSVSGTGTATFLGTGGAIWTAAGAASTNFLASSGARLQAAGTASATFFAAGGGRLFVTGIGSAGFVGSTTWDLMLEQDDAPIAYFAELEPWVLADRS